MESSGAISKILPVRNPAGSDICAGNAHTFRRTTSVWLRPWTPIPCRRLSGLRTADTGAWSRCGTYPSLRARTLRYFEKYKGLFKSDDPEMEIRFCECYREKSDLRPFKVSDSKKNLFSEYDQRETSKKLFAQFTQTLDIIERIIKSDFPGN